jgi:putative ABC transport system ATP-binding protein
LSSIMQVKSLTKKYRIGQETITALNSIDLEVREGEFLCVLGTSGSGKSTLLHLMAGLERPTKGEIMINGKLLTGLKEKDMAHFRRKYMGFVFQSYNLIPTMTALENVTLPLIFDNSDVKERSRMAREVLIQMGLKERMKHKPTQMSGGQQQRVSIARALINNPRILFADEPTGNLDTRTTKEIMDILKERVTDYGLTLVMVTHDSELADYADRSVYMVDGMITKIVEKGVPA